MASKAVDLYVIYQIIKRISTPFEDTDAYKLGLIDAKGKKLKKAMRNLILPMKVYLLKLK